jgi:hypothetical protein
MPPDEGTYSLPTAGTVRDEVSKLLWQRTVPTPTYNWADAKRYCAGLTLDGISGWRLPTVIELVSLLDYTRSGPAIYAVPFPSTPSEAFWTSTVVAGSTGQAWWVRFSDGGTWIDNASVVHRVRCVR